MLNRYRMYGPMLREVGEKFWPDMPLPTVLYAQIEQESLWNPRAELKTGREQGFGLGQITVTDRFNNFDVVKRQQPALRDWQWADRFDPTKQLIALLTMDANEYRACQPLMMDSFNALACMLARYNGGAGGFNADRRLCSNSQGCNPRKWFGNVAEYSTKSKVAAVGYGKSFFDINREYAYNGMFTRRAKYAPVMPCL